MAKGPAEMLIESVKMELPDTKTLHIKWPDGYEVDFKTGQFIVTWWPDTPTYKRSYSLSSCALDRGFYEVTIKREGKMGTRMVDWAKAGDKVMVLPPAGRFLPVFDPPGKHLICIAGGSGITPFRGFVREATRLKHNTRITIIYSVRTTTDIIFNEEFRALEQENPNFKFLVTCTRLPDVDPWTGRRGRITPEFVKEIAGADVANTVFYACGPNALVDGAEQLVLKDLALPKEQLRLEKWG
jgi:ferredoxin-NADP reductase